MSVEESMPMATRPEKVPGNFHALYDRGSRAARRVSIAPDRAERPEIARMAAEMPDAVVHLDEATQNPVQITAGRRPGRLSMRAAGSPESAAREFRRCIAEPTPANEIAAVLDAATQAEAAAHKQLRLAEAQALDP